MPERTEAALLASDPAPESALLASFAHGDRVYVIDPPLAELRAIMSRFGHVAYPNHFGTVEEVMDDGDLLIYFDDGSGAPYPAADTRHLTPEEEARWPKRPEAPDA